MVGSSKNNLFACARKIDQHQVINLNPLAAFTLALCEFELTHLE